MANEECPSTSIGCNAVDGAANEEWEKGAELFS